MRSFLKKMLWIALCTALLCAASALVICAATYPSDTAANAAGCPVRVGEEGGSGYYTSLDSAIDAAQAGDTVTVFGETTVDNTIVLTKDDLTLTGTGKVTADIKMFAVRSATVQNVTFAGDLVLETSANSILRAENNADVLTVTIDGATLRSADNTPLWLGGNITQGNVILLDGTLAGDGYYGIYFANTTGAFTLDMRGGTVTGKRNGIRTDSGTTTLALTGGTVTHTSSETSYGAIYAMNDTGGVTDVSITVNGATILSNSCGILLERPAAVTVSGGLVEAAVYPILCKAACRVTVNGGTLHSLTNNVINFNSGASTFTVNGGKLYNDAASGFFFTANAANTVVNVTGGDINMQNAVFTWRGDIEINISGGHIYGLNNVFYGYAPNAVLRVSGGELLAGSGSTLQLLKNNISLEISGGLISTSPNSNNYAVHIASDAAGCRVNVTGGSFTAHGGGAPFHNMNASSTITLSGGFAAAGGSRLLYDEATSARSIAYPSGTALYAGGGFYTVAGAQISMRAAYNGIRFLSRLDAAAAAALTAKGATDLAFGTLILPLQSATAVPAVTMFELERAGVPYADVKGLYGVQYDEDEGYTVKAALINLKEKNITRDFTAVGYITYTIDGQTYTQYAPWSETDHVRNIGTVARAALADGGYTARETETLNSFAHFQAATIAGNKVNDSTYEIVYATAKDQSNKTYNPFTTYYTALLLADHLCRTTGYQLNVLPLASATGKKQIRIGCDAAPAGENTYRIAVQNGNLSVTGTDYIAYFAAQEQLTEAVFPLASRTVALSGDFAVQDVNHSAEAALAAKSGNLRVMFNNIWGGSTYPGDSAYNMPQRMDLAEAIYSTYAPDVLGLQEYHDKLRAELHPRLLALGYAEVPVESSSINPTVTYSPNTVTNAKKMTTSVNSTPLYYNPQTVELLQYGYFWYADIDFTNSAYAAILGNYSAATVRGRTATDYSKGFTWAIFRHKATGKVFLAGSTHLWWKSEITEDDLCRQIEVSYAKEYLLARADEWLNANGGLSGTMPIFFGGDMNTNASRTSFSRFAAQTPTQSGSSASNVFVNLNDLSVGAVAANSTTHSYANYDPTRGIYYMPKYNKNAYASSIDYIFTNEAAVDDALYTVNAMVRVADLYAHLLTDHCPIFTDVTFLP